MQQILLEMFYKAANELKVKFTQNQLQQFIDYVYILEKWQKRQNLVKYSSLEDLVLYHFIDSLQALRAACLKDSKKIIDIGTGAGFPGVPLKICLPSIVMFLNETQSKRIFFLEELIKELTLNECYLLQGRAEFYAHQVDCREVFDCVLTRAVASLNVVLELSLPFLKIGGRVIAFRGLNAFSELASAENALKLLGGELEDVITYYLGNNKNNIKTYHLVIIKKILETPIKYPRKAGIPQKRPL